MQELLVYAGLKKGIQDKFTSKLGVAVGLVEPSSVRFVSQKIMINRSSRVIYRIDQKIINSTITLYKRLTCLQPYNLFHKHVMLNHVRLNPSRSKQLINRQRLLSEEPRSAKSIYSLPRHHLLQMFIFPRGSPSQIHAPQRGCASLVP